MGRNNLASLALALIAMPAAIAPVAAQAAQQGAEPAANRLALAREVIDLGVPKATREAMFGKVMDQMMGQMREAALQNVKVQDPKAVAILDAWLAKWAADSKLQLRAHIPALMDGWAAAYADIYTEQELTDIRAFVATPSGATFMQKQQDVIGNPKFAAANQAYMSEVMSRLPAAQAELMATLKAHFEAR
jgi:hypothetical protein